MWYSTNRSLSIDDKAFCNNKKVKINSDKITKVGDGAFEGIAKNAVIYVKSGKRYKEIVALIKASGAGDGVKFKKLK